MFSGHTDAFLAKINDEKRCFYVKTKMLEKVEQVLNHRAFVILVGQEGTGKTNMAIHLMLKYRAYENFIVRRIRSPQEFQQYYDVKKKSFFFIENIFDCSEQHLYEWRTIFRLMQETAPSPSLTTVCQSEIRQFEFYAVFTSRTNDFKDAKRKELFRDFFPENNIVIIANDALTKDEKKDILLKNMEYARHVHGIEETRFSKDDWEDITKSSPPFGFPLCAQLFACEEMYRKAGKQFFSNPYGYVLWRLKGLIRQDETRHTEVLFILILICKFQNKTCNCNDPVKCWEDLCELQINDELQLQEEHVQNLQEVLCRLRNIYVMETEKNVLQFIHTSVEEAVQQYFFETYPRKAVALLPLPMLFERLHKQYISTLAPIILKQFIHRLKKEIQNDQIHEVFKYQEFKDEDFSMEFLKQIKSDATDFTEILRSKNYIGHAPFIYTFTETVCSMAVIELLKSLKEVISGNELFDNYYFSLLASCSLQDKHDVIQYILEQYPDIQNAYTRKIGRTQNTNDCYFSPLLEATKHQNENAIQNLIKRKATFPLKIWRGWPFLHACYKESQLCCAQFLISVYAFEEKRFSKNENEDKFTSKKIISVQENFFDKIVFKIDRSIEKNESMKNILLDLIDVYELQITVHLIEAFCSLHTNEGYLLLQQPLNFKDKNGNSIIHLYLKYRVHPGQNYFSKSDDEEYFSGVDDYTCTPGSAVELSNKHSNVALSPLRSKIIQSKSKHIETVELLSKNKTDFNAKNNLGETPLMIELSKQHPSKEIVECLLFYGAHPDEKDARGRTSLHLLLSSVYEKNVPVSLILEKLISYQATVNIKDGYNDYPICIELKRKRPRIKVLRVLLNGDVDLNVSNPKGQSPLFMAMQLSKDENKRRIKIVQVLLCSKHLCICRENGDDMVLFKDVLSDLQHNENILKVIASHKSCHYPLHDCIKTQVDEETKIKALKILTSTTNKKLQFSAVNKEKETLLITASKFCPDMSNLIEYLISNNINVDAKDVAHKTALVYLIDFGQFSLCNTILDLMKSDLNVPVDKMKQTYLHHCVKSKLSDKERLEICKRLFRKGVNVNTKDRLGVTCIDRAFRFPRNNYPTLKFFMKICKPDKFDIDKSFECLAYNGNLKASIVKFAEKCIIKQQIRAPGRNFFHYLATVHYYQKYHRKSVREKTFESLKKIFPLNSTNGLGKIPLHVVIETNASVSCVLDFLRVSSEFVDMADSDENTALHLLVKSNREDSDVFTIVKEMLKYNIDVNAKNEGHKTPLMLAVECEKDRLRTVAEILKKRPNLRLHDRSGFTILHHCINVPKDDQTACSLLSLFLDSDQPVDINKKSTRELSALNLAAMNGQRSRILCFCKLLQHPNCKTETFDKFGRSPLYNTANSLKGINPVIVLERYLRSYILLVHGDSPDFLTNEQITVYDICEDSNYCTFIETGTSGLQDACDTIKRAWLKVARQPENTKNDYDFRDILCLKTKIDDKMKTLILDSLPYLSHREFSELPNECLNENCENLSSDFYLEQ